MEQAHKAELKRSGEIMTNLCHAAAATWWTDLKTGEDLRMANNVPEKLMLIVSELAEAMEGHRKNQMDDKLPHRPMVEVELADAVIRIFDLAGAKGYDVAGAIVEKLAFNAQRADHKPESRLAEGGKAY
jgi:NTP pyrophosphatase (non-canonical NTP hydrolase)